MTAMIEVKNLTMGYGSYVLQQNANFVVNRGDIFIIMGGSGCGKSSMLRVLTGLLPPLGGDVIIDGVNIAKASATQMEEIRKKSGMLYQKIGRAHV